MEGGRCRGDLTSQPGPPPVGALFQAEPKAGISGRLAPALFQLSALILGEDCVLLLFVVWPLPYHIFSLSIDNSFSLHHLLKTLLSFPTDLYNPPPISLYV